MKVAAFISGEPRFCREFDLFLEKLTGYEEIDWYFFLWENSAPTSAFLRMQGHEVVAPFWQNLTVEKAKSKLVENLPKNHHVIAVELEDSNKLIHEEIQVNYAEEVFQSSVWKMFYAIYKADQLRIKYEEENNFKYDMVIRTRPDVCLNDHLDLNDIKNRLAGNDKVVIMPSNKHCGYGVHVCDLFGIASSDTMKVYSDLYNHIPRLHESGIKFHPETLLGNYLKRSGLINQRGNFNIDFRILGNWRNIDSGQVYKSSEIRNWNNHLYISDFGRWA